MSLKPLGGRPRHARMMSPKVMALLPAMASSSFTCGSAQCGSQRAASHLHEIHSHSSTFDSSNDT